MVLWGKAGASDLSLGWGTATELYSEHELPSVFLGIEGAVDEDGRRVPVMSSRISFFNPLALGIVSTVPSKSDLGA